MKQKSPLYFVLLFLLMKTGPASTQEIFFNKVLPPEGKTFKHVSGIVQDMQGYMWFATKTGLFRYDGYQMISYKNNISQHTYELVKEQFNGVHRGKIEAKNKGEIDMYFVE